MGHGPTCFLSRRLAGRSIPDRGGRAVFAVENVPAGEVLAVWGGEVVNQDWLRRAGPAVARLALQIEENLYLVSIEEGPADWINHSCEPNAGLRGQVALVALRDIRAGEEICYDYAMSDGSAYDVIECHCGTATCRGRITGRDWRNRSLQRRYHGYFSPYLQARIDRELERQRNRAVFRRRARVG